MGVTGDVLKRILRTAGRPVDLFKYSHGIEDHSNKRRKLRPLRIGLDVSVWIAQAAHGNGGMLVDDRHLTDYGRAQLKRGGEETELDLLTSEENRCNYVRVCTQRVLSQIISLQSSSKADMLVVLDGASPPIKRQECNRRRAKKRKAEAERDTTDDNKTLERRIRAAKVAGAGQSQGAIVAELMQLLRENEIAFIVSPYEADGQLAHLAQCGIVDVVMTEDSDLLCHDIQTVLFKYDGNGGGTLVQRQDLGAMELQSQSLSLLDFSTTMIAIMFVCIGCDYCDSLAGIGCVTARDAVREVFSSNKSDVPVLRRIFDTLYSVSRSVLNEEEIELYEERFMAALFQYQHPVIFCPLSGKCVLANDPPRGSDPLLLEYEPYAALCNDVEKQRELVGAFPERRLQLAITEGWVCPWTNTPRANTPFPNVALPDYVQALFAPEQEQQPSVTAGPAEGQNDTGGEQQEEMLPESNETQDGEVDDEPETQGEQRAAEDTQEDSNPPGTQDNETQQLETQAFQRQETTPDTPGTQPDAPGTQLPETQAFQMQQTTTDTSGTQQSDLGQYQQPSQGSDVQQPSSQNSDEFMEDSDGPVGLVAKPIDHTQEGIKSPFPSTQSSRTTNSSSKFTSQSTASDTLSPPLLP